MVHQLFQLSPCPDLHPEEPVRAFPGLHFDLGRIVAHSSIDSVTSPDERVVSLAAFTLSTTEPSPPARPSCRFGRLDEDDVAELLGPRLVVPTVATPPSMRAVRPVLGKAQLRHVVLPMHFSARSGTNSIGAPGVARRRAPSLARCRSGGFVFDIAHGDQVPTLGLDCRW